MARHSGGGGGTKRRFHQSKRNRNVSNYRKRLEKRGQSPASVRMLPLDMLRRRARARGEPVEEGEAA